MVDDETLGATNQTWNRRRRGLVHFPAVVMRVPLQKQRQKILVEGGSCRGPKNQASVVRRPEIGQGASPGSLEVLGEGLQRKSKRMSQGVADPARAQRLQAMRVQTDGFLNKSLVKPQPRLQSCRERQGLAAMPFRPLRALDGESAAIGAMHHQEELWKVPRIDFNGCAIG